MKNIVESEPVPIVYGHEELVGPEDMRTSVRLISDKCARLPKTEDHFRKHREALGT